MVQVDHPVLEESHRPKSRIGRMLQFMFESEEDAGDKLISWDWIPALPSHLPFAGVVPELPHGARDHHDTFTSQQHQQQQQQSGKQKHKTSHFDEYH